VLGDGQGLARVPDLRDGPDVGDVGMTEREWMRALVIEGTAYEIGERLRRLCSMMERTKPEGACRIWIGDVLGDTPWVAACDARLLVWRLMRLRRDAHSDIVTACARRLCVEPLHLVEQRRTASWRPGKRHQRSYCAECALDFMLPRRGDPGIDRVRGYLRKLNRELRRRST
jgi:hypothetical protein